MQDLAAFKDCLAVPPPPQSKAKNQLASELSVCRRGAAMRRFVYTFVCCAFVGIVDLASFLPAMAAATKAEASPTGSGK
jgi:hypothetical protein